jgi:hypothetical protein
MKYELMTPIVRWLALPFVCACASISAIQTFELTTESAAMPALPNVPTNQPQTLSLTAGFGSCSKSALGDLERVRANSHVDSLDVWVNITDIKLRSDATFSGIQSLSLSLATHGDAIPVCSLTLSAAEQQSSQIDCPSEQHVRAEQLCPTAGSTTTPAQITMQLTVNTGDVTLTKLSATIQLETEVDADVSL